MARAVDQSGRVRREAQALKEELRAKYLAGVGAA